MILLSLPLYHMLLNSDIKLMALLFLYSIDELSIIDESWGPNNINKF